MSLSGAYCPPRSIHVSEEVKFQRQRIDPVVLKDQSQSLSRSPFNTLTTLTTSTKPIQRSVGLYFYRSGLNISKNNTWHQVHSERLAHLTHQTSIANQDATSIWRCVLILRHLTSRARAQSWYRPLCPLRPDGAWCTALASWIPLILGCSIRVSPGTTPYRQGPVWRTTISSGRIWSRVPPLASSMADLGHNI